MDGQTKADGQAGRQTRIDRQTDRQMEKYTQTYILELYRCMYVHIKTHTITKIPYTLIASHVTLAIDLQSLLAGIE